MEFNEAIKLISQNFEVESLGENMIEIYTNQMLNDYNSAFLVLVKVGDGCHLTDLAKTCDNADIGDDVLMQIAEKNNLIFDNFYIKKVFNNENDLVDFLNFFDDIASFSQN